MTTCQHCGTQLKAGLTQVPLIQKAIGLVRIPALAPDDDRTRPWICDTCRKETECGY